MSKVSDWNSFRVNQNYSDSFRYLYQSQLKSFRTNPKNVLYLVWWKTIKNQSDLIQLITRHQSEWIRTNEKPSFQSRSIGINSSLDWSKPNFQLKSIQMNPRSEWQIDSDWKFVVDQSELGFILIDLDWKLDFGLVRIHLDWCLGINRIKLDWFLTFFHQTRYKTFFGLFRNDLNWLGYKYRNESK